MPTVQRAHADVTLSEPGEIWRSPSAIDTATTAASTFPTIAAPKSACLHPLFSLRLVDPRRRLPYARSGSLTARCLSTPASFLAFSLLLSDILRWQLGPAAAPAPTLVSRVEKKHLTACLRSCQRKEDAQNKRQNARPKFFLQRSRSYL
ncbi:hypothetical protein MATL_G00179560 [Megalops atlanticus]|uniref:Uncharacterized protein n=1 Tax=Megalops atlanticus TaxID=7932 RepID=A0A9D3PM06_MEGAT|nr:hypothetical protein MATL_G00179560 [Megalops atlanticus]